MTDSEEFIGSGYGGGMPWPMAEYDMQGGAA